MVMSDGRLKINEIFLSIQGESTWAGCPCVFIRLSGCHLRCSYCDTAYAFTQGKWREAKDVIEEVCSHSTQLVQITGGEPLLQQAVHPLISELCDSGKTVLIETSGACDINCCDSRAIRILDFKTPGSGESDRNDWSNISYITTRDEVKFVITDKEDYDWVKNIIQEHKLQDRCNAVLLSPVMEQLHIAESDISGCCGLDPKELSHWILTEPPTGGPVRMQLQLHKFIWDPQMRGV